MRLIIFSISIMCLVAPGMISAQELTDAELLEMFNKQRDAFTEAQTTGVSKTRSISIVPAQTTNTEPAATETATTAAPATETATTTQTAIKPQNHGQLAEDLQINVSVEFSFDSATLAASEKTKLAQLCKVMRVSTIGLFRIIGHTDATGSDAYNEKLSLLRAQEVKRFFTSDCGMESHRLEAVGFGELFPSNRLNPDAPENRRVEFQAIS